MYLYNIVWHKRGNELPVKRVPDQGHHHRYVGSVLKLVVLGDKERDLGRVLDLVFVQEHLVVDKAGGADNLRDFGQRRQVREEGESVSIKLLTENQDLFVPIHPHVVNLQISEAVNKYKMRTKSMQ